MKKRILMKMVMLACLVIAFMSCNDIEQANPNEAAKWKIPSNLVGEYALAYRASQNSEVKYKSGENTNYTICEIDSFVDKNDLTAMYVINFCNDSGWVILSADYRMEPIMAYNDEGSFGYGVIPAGLAIWIEGSVQLVEEIREHNVKHPSADIAWTVSLNDYGLDDDIPSRPDIGINGGLGPGDLDPCLLGVISSTFTKGELLNTTWGQGCTYNTDSNIDSCSTGGACDKMWTGCVATATGQIMQYWGEPQSSFDFSIMSLNNGDAEVSKLMEDIGDEVNMNYSCTGSSSSSSDARQCLENVYGYSNPKYDPYDLGIVISDILADKPVYLRGCHTQTTRGWWIFKWKVEEDCHAWVCDGYTYKYRKCPNKPAKTWGKQLHMNWGWHEVWPTTLSPRDSDYNGWYSFGDWNPRDASSNSNFNFQFANKMIHDISR